MNRTGSGAGRAASSAEPAGLLRIDTTGSPDMVRLHARGEFDRDNCDLITAAFTGAIVSGPAGTILDLAEVTFIDAATVRALATAGDLAVTAGATLHVQNASGVVALVLTIAGVARPPDHRRAAVNGCSAPVRGRSGPVTTPPAAGGGIYGPTRAFVYSFAQSLRQELLDSGVTVTALLPGATATEFHERAGMGGTRFGDNSWKTDPELVARKGFDGLMAGRDHVIGGDRATWCAAVRQRILPERIKAAQFAKASRPR
jgi:anti-anti-sigma factor